MKLGIPRISRDARGLVKRRPKLTAAVTATLVVGLTGLGVGLSGVGSIGVASAAKPVGPPIPPPPTAPCSGAVITHTFNDVTTPGTCHGTATLQQQVDRLTTTINYYMKPYTTKGTMKTHISTSNGVGFGQVLDYGVVTLWESGIDGNGVTAAVMEEWSDNTAPTLKNSSASNHTPWTTTCEKPVATGGTGLSAAACPAVSTLFPDGPLPTKTNPGTYSTLEPTGSYYCPEGMIVLGSYGSCSAWIGELNLDVEAVHEFAPYAHIVVSATPADSQITDDPAYNVAAPELMHAVAYVAGTNPTHKALAQTISISDGTSETTYADGWSTLTAQDVAEAEAAADGVPVLVATGDCGVIQNLAAASSQCGNASSTPQTAAWDDSPWITAVGGSKPHITKAKVKTPSTGKTVTVGVKSENDTLTSIEGAGFSALYAKPAFQDTVNSTNMRSVPTVVMDSADGTSQAAPTFNGILALATQLFNVGNKGTEKTIGPIQTALYKIGSQGAAAGILNVVTGNDTSAASTKTTYKTSSHPVGPRIATPGWKTGNGFNVASGWGSVTANKFIYALDQETTILKTEASARAAAAAQAATLKKLQTYTTPNSDDTFVMAKTLIPNHPVKLYVTTEQVWPLNPSAGTWTYDTANGYDKTALTVAERQYIVDSQGYVTFMITPVKVPKPTAKFTKTVVVHTARNNKTITEPTLTKNTTTFYKLTPGTHVVRISSLLMTQTATFTVATGY